MKQIVVATGAALLSLSQNVVARPSKCNGTLPLVQDKLLRDAITTEALLKHSQDLEDIAYSTPGRNRVTGSEGHQLTVDYITDQLEALGDYYTVEQQPWTGSVQLSGNATFSVNGVEYESAVLEFSPSGEAIDVPLVPVDNLGCEASDVPAEVDGAIALVHRGECNFSVKSANAKAAGALGVVFWNNIPGGIAGTYGGDVGDEVAPGAGISQADGETLLALVGNSTVTASLLVSTDIQTQESFNVIATSKYGDPDNVLFLGAHSDSVAAGPGINDDGSGTVGILETAIQLSKYRTKSQVKFGWWTAEEAGLLGSTYYVESLSDEELLKIRLYLNFDMIASPNFIFGHYDGDGSEFGEVGPAGSAEAEHFFEEYYESIGVNHTATEFNGRSDYGAFLENGVPCGGLDAGADEIKSEEEVAMFGGTAGIILDPNYHSAGDDVSNLNLTCFEVMAKGIGSAVATYAGSGFADFPLREQTVEKRAVRATSSKKRGANRLYKTRFPVYS